MYTYIGTGESHEAFRVVFGPILKQFGEAEATPASFHISTTPSIIRSHECDTCLQLSHEDRLPLNVHPLPAPPQLCITGYEFFYCADHKTLWLVCIYVYLHVYTFVLLVYY